MTIELTFPGDVFCFHIWGYAGNYFGAQTQQRCRYRYHARSQYRGQYASVLAGLLLAYFFALVLKGTPFRIASEQPALSGDVDGAPGEGLGAGRLIGSHSLFASLVSNSAILNGLLTGNFALVSDALRHLILPAVAVGTISLAVIARMTRSSLLDVLGQDYMRAARAKGLAYDRVITKHALRNALIPIVTIIGIQTGGLLGGAVLTETIFSLPGVGSRMVEAI